MRDNPYLSPKQIDRIWFASAVGEGSMAVHLVHRYFAQCADQYASAQQAQTVPASITSELAHSSPPAAI
jgi:hypothetical protein